MSGTTRAFARSRVRADSTVVTRQGIARTGRTYPLVALISAASLMPSFGFAVGLGTDGYGQVLLYPWYTSLLALFLANRCIATYPGWTTGNATVAFLASRPLPAPPRATTILDTRTGALTTGATVTYFGLPVVGFALQSYSNGSLPVDGRPVLSNYGVTFRNRQTRRITVAP